VSRSLAERWRREGKTTRMREFLIGDCVAFVVLRLVFPYRAASQEIGLGNVSEMTYFVSSGT